MGFSKLMTLVFGVAFMIILYFIIYYALKIMYKDVKGSGRRKQSSAKKNYGIEVLSTGENSNLEEGSILLLRGTITIGRKEGNTIKLDDQYASGNHAKIIVKNNINNSTKNNKTLDEYILEAKDLIKKEN